MSKLIQELSGLSYNSKGALSAAGTGSNVLDFFTKSGAFRQADNATIIKAFEAAYAEDRDLALKALFYSRDVRGGQGERKVFRVITSYLANKNPDALRPLVKFFAEYGRWDDLIELALTPLEEVAFAVIASQLAIDNERYACSQPISLLAKWLPSENASSKHSKMLARRLAQYLGLDSKQYRQTLSRLRAALKVVERDLCSKDYTSINYEHVPSKASLIYRKAFHRNDEARYTAFKSKVKKGEAKINTKVLFPYELIAPLFPHDQMHKVGDSYYCTTRTLPDFEEDTLNLLWNNLPNYLGKEPEDGLAVVDTSGSMRGLPIKVAISLGLYYADRNKGAFAGHFITFSEKPQLQKVKGETIGEKVRNLAATHWNGTTNLQAVFDLVLDRAVKSGLKQEDLPSRIFVISDMQFDIACPKNTFTNTEVIAQKYAEAGYKAPELVFWNVNAYAGNTPVKKDSRGLKMVSGCSGEIFKQVLASKQDNPYGLMLETLLAPRYEPICYYGNKSK